MRRLTPRGAEKAVFDVIVEGQGEAYRRVGGDGTNGLCQVSSQTASSEIYEYGRGRGLRVVFTRLGRAVLIQRAGRRSPLVSFNVRGSVTSRAEGQASRSGPVPCAATTGKVGDEAGCGRKARAFRVTLRSGEIQKQFDSPNPTFDGRALENAEHRAVVRFVRVQGDGG
jgi:hypothetical protein